MLIPLTLALTLLAGPLRASGPCPWPEGKMLRGANITEDITEADIRQFVHDWKGNCVRLLVNDISPESPPYGIAEQKKKKMFDCLDLCLRNGLYTVFSVSVSFRDNNRFFADEHWKAAYQEFWEEVARRYADSSGFAYDLLNEPHDSLARTLWLPYARELTRAIRQIDSVHTIVVEPPEWGWPNGFDNFEPTGDANTVYSFHFYGPMDYTHQRNNGHLKATEQQWRQRVYPGQLQGEYWDKAKLAGNIDRAVRFRDKYAVPVWCGEFGVARWAMGAEQWFRDFIDLLEADNIGWAYYAYREWWAMDIEMDPAARLERTARGETSLVKLFKSYFIRNVQGHN